MSFHLRKYLSKKREKTIVDRLMSGAAIVHPLTAVPQVYSIYTTKDVAGISLLTWIGFMILGTVFLAYGVVHKLKPFIVTQVLWFTVDTLIVAGILLYG